jgi:hypothetical protein
LRSGPKRPAWPSIRCCRGAGASASTPTISPAYGV